MNNLVEKWLAIPGYEGQYEVSNFGRVKSVRRFVRGRYGMRTVPEKILKPGPSNSGHVSVSLNRNNSKSVHKLVMLAFVGEVPDGLEVLHLNHEPSDNRLENLKYGTRSENMRMDYAVGTRKVPLEFVYSMNGQRTKPYSKSNEQCDA